jgi:hypothetical protein
MGQLIQSIGPVRVEVHILALILFFSYCTILLPHIYYYNCTYFKLPVTKYLSLLCRLKINDVREIRNMHFYSWALYTMVVNIMLLYIVIKDGGSCV